MVAMVYLDQVENKVKLVYQVLVVPLVKWVHQVLMEEQDSLEKRAKRECLELMVYLDNLDKMAQMDSVGLKEYLEMMVLKVKMARLDPEEKRD
jgi:hypothetical protein